MKNLLIYLSFFSILFLVTCKPNEVTPDPTIPTVTTGTVSNIAQTTANITGNLTAFGTNYTQVNQYGFCYSSTIVTPTISDTKIELQTKNALGEFTSPINGLIANTKYYIRAFATNATGTAYGDVKEFTTLQAISLPTVSTTSITNPTVSTASGGGNITSDGGATVTARGICWNTTGNPTITDTHTADGTGTSTFVSNLTGLTANTTYHVRAYATNSVGTAYGADVPFSTIAYTINITSPTNTTNWMMSTSQNITWTDNLTEPVKIELYKGVSLISTLSSSESGNSFNWNIIPLNLTVGADYNIKITSTTNSSLTKISGNFTISIYKGTLTDYDGNIYNTIQIGSQIWTKENLKVTKTPSGASISSSYYADNATNIDILGRLYSWSVANQVCPTGWHLPSYAEWTTLINYLGGASIAGGKMKVVETTYWGPPNVGGTNESGFSAIGSGYYAGGYNQATTSANFWSATEVNSTNANYLMLYYTNTIATLTNDSKLILLSIRCIKN